MAPPVAIIAFDGMQSRRLAAPPTMSRSISVTSTPRRAAYVAACVPAGPPPMITNRMGRGYAVEDATNEALLFDLHQRAKSCCTIRRPPCYPPSMAYR